VTTSGATGLADGEAYVDASSWRAVSVTGPDAAGWLNDLVSADLAGIPTGRALASLLLGPTGGVLAAFTVAVEDEGFVLIQDPDQPSVADLLSRYVLSSGVRVEDVSGISTILALPGLVEPPAVAIGRWRAPSCLSGSGGDGHDLVGPADAREAMLNEMRDHASASRSDAEAWRVLAAVPKLGVDTEPADLPHECGMSAAVAEDKGCFLGQEAVARSRRGRPRRLLLPVLADGPIAPGDEVRADGAAAGRVTSAADVDGVHLGLARVVWAHREGPWRTASGSRLERRRVA
jgi:hypothetical protein